ncbi:MAG: hypothetical protein H6720_28810 [Sandaracinus sp.]|nr:hypothetical protein [Sandaracinus sp.]
MRVGLSLVALVSFVLLVGATEEPRTADGAVRGVALGLFASDPTWDYGPMVRELRARGATDVLIVVQVSQHDRFASDLAFVPGHAPNEATLVRTLRQAKAAGLRVALMPIVHLRVREDHEWRGMLAPADGVDTWFARYRGVVGPLATLATREGVERFVVGSELSSLEPFEAEWRATIAAVRSRFAGTLVYSTNWDRIAPAEGAPGPVAFWDALDEVGLTAYFPVGQGDSAPTAEAMRQAWRSPRGSIEALARRVGRPVVLTEVGYPSRRGATRAPWDDGPGAHVQVDLSQQREAWAGFCDAFVTEVGSVRGFYAWNWFGVGGTRDSGFTLRGKPAAVELERCFARWPGWEER